MGLFNIEITIIHFLERKTVGHKCRETFLHRQTIAPREFLAPEQCPRGTIQHALVWVARITLDTLATRHMVVPAGVVK